MNNYQEMASYLAWPKVSDWAWMIASY